MTTLPSAPPAESWYVRWSRRLPLAVLLLVLLLSAALSGVVSRLISDQQRVRFQREIMAHTMGLQQRITTYDNLLQATRAFWLANPQDVSPTAFEEFGRSLNMGKRYPDVQALGYNAWLPTGEEGTLETLAALMGLQNYQVRPAATDQSYRAPIVLITPNTPVNRVAQGFDMFTEPIRRDALERAAKVGEFQVSAEVPLVQTDAAGQHYPGFLLVLPIFRDPDALPDPQNLQGFIYMAIRADTFLSSLNSAYNRSGISSNTLLGGKPIIQPQELTGAFRETSTFKLGGLDWQVNYAAPSSFGRDALWLVPFLTFFAGTLVSFVAYRVMRSQVLSREFTEAANHNLREAQLRQNRARAEFEAIFQSMQDAAAFTDAGGKIRMVNRAMNSQFRVSQGDLSGQSLSSLHLDRHLDEQSSFQSITTPYQRRDGSVFQGESQRTEVRDQQGELLGLLEVVRDVSERVEAEQAIRAEESRSRGVLDAIPHILWVSDPVGHISYTNAQHRKRLGDLAVRERVNPEDRPSYDRMWRDAYALRTRAQCEVRLQVGGTGNMWGGALRDRWFEIRVAPLLGADGQASEWVASATDIHDRLVAERLAQRNEERYRGVLEGMPQIVWLTDAVGQPTYFNRQWETYVGLERAGQGLLPALHPDDRAEYQANWAQAVRAGRNFEAEHRLLGEDGIYRTFVTRGLPVRDKTGQIIEWVGTSTDVDASVYAENASRLLADVSTELTTRVNDPLAVRGAKYSAVLDLITGRFMVAASIWTVPDLQLLASSQNDTNWELPHLRQAVVEAMRTVVQTGEVWEVSAHPLLHAVAASGGLMLPLIGLDGTLRGVLGLAYRQELLDRDHELVGELTQRIASALDNDALRDRAQEAQNELRSLNQSLEERVQRRTLELEDANKELEAFSYSVSHDLRTPLRHIVGFGDLLRKDTQDSLSPKSSRYLTVITDAAGRMNTLIDSLLEFSRMGRMPLRAVPVALTEVVEGAWRNLEPDRAGRQVVFHLEDLPVIEGDSALLDLVFQNLLSNAIKYTRTKPVAHVWVSAERLTDALGGDQVKITVRDNGVGFDAKYADKLFGVFQRLHRAEEFDGTGIGLANVRRIVTRHGGTVGAQAVMGEGSNFYVTLPLRAKGLQE